MQNKRVRSTRGGVGGLCPPAKARRERARVSALSTRVARGIL